MTGGVPEGAPPVGVVLLCGPRVFRAPEGPAVWPGRCVCRWAAARPRVVRAASLRLGASSRSPARPRHRPPAPRQLPPAPTGTAARACHRPPALRLGSPGPPAPSIPVGPGVLMGSALEGLRLYARKSSPCVDVRSRKREKVRPARSNWPKFDVFMRAGRTFSRKCRRRGRAGRTFSRQPVLCPGLVGDAAYFVLAAMGVLQH